MISELTPPSWCGFWCADLVTLQDDLCMLVGDGCDDWLRLFKQKVLIAFGDNADDWLLDNLEISSFTCGILKIKKNERIRNIFLSEIMSNLRFQYFVIAI